ncbi:MAG: response regulator transcription factor [Acidimicrobiia bacterium]|nr:response regulator transcription factor [Acidimicrobiia bacterium]
MARRTRPRRVLVADDDADILKVVAANLKAEGIVVEAVSNGWEAQARALSTAPDLIILDIGMPGRTGLEVMEGLRSKPETANIPVVFLTARSSDADVWEGWKAGAAYYLPKPFDTAELMHFVNSMFDPKARAR